MVPTSCSSCSPVQTQPFSRTLVCALPQRGYKVKALSRSKEKARQLLGDAEGLEVVIADMRDPDSPQLAAALEGVDAVCCCTGTTAFPSKR